MGRDIYIDVPYLTTGDYTDHPPRFDHPRPEKGHNCWFGHYTIIDSLGGDAHIGNNVGVGAHSQLWSHMKFRDTLNGCRWTSGGRLHLVDNILLVGHCVVGPIHAKKRSMLC